MTVAATNDSDTDIDLDETKNTVNEVVIKIII